MLNRQTNQSIEIKGNVEQANISIGDNNQQQLLSGNVKWVVLGLGILLILAVLFITLFSGNSIRIDGDGNTVIQDSEIELRN
ncbi:hypothetical protein [Candidatus Albibeggiatoa sp. nov. NOAA]|uniref:hypothetical protein n=1 Tax=Candidatus Albibeggiatoa sp. nov. NOAA TaxID=3162724 RepID=UPI0032FD46F8|nr:hypothetical protein [Thiotrichaceae bacterium]